MSGKTVSSQLSSTCSTASSSLTSSSASEATYHLEALNAILTHRLPQEMIALRAEKQLVEHKYNKLDEKYKQLLDQHSCQQKELEELRAFKAIVLKVETRDNECQTDRNDYSSHSLIDNKEKLRRKLLFLCANDSDVTSDNTILVNDSSDGQKFVNTSAYENDWISDNDIDEVPDSLNGSPISCKHIKQENDGNTNAKNSGLCDDLSDINISEHKEDIVMTDEFPEEIPDSLDNSPIAFDFNIKKEKNVSPIACDVNINEERNVNEVLKSSTESSVIEITDDDSNTDTISNITKPKLAHSKQQQQQTKITNYCTKRDKSVKLVVKTLGPAVRKKEDRKQLNGYSCKECEDYYSKRYEGITDEEMRKKMTKCSRHRAKWSPVRSPEHFWSTDFPSTQELLRNGNMNRDDEKHSPIRGVKSKKKLKL